MNIKTYSDFKNHKFEYNEKIPKVVYRTGNDELKDLPDVITDIYERQMIINEEYTMFYFTQKDRLDFFASLGDDRIYNAYKKLIPEAYKADFFRYVIVYYYGGIYMDYSMDAYIPYDDIVKDYDLLTVKDISYYGLFNAFLAGKKENKILKKAIEICLDNIENEKYNKETLDVTSCMVLGNAYKTVCKKKEIHFGEDAENNLFIFYNSHNQFIIEVENIEDITGKKIIRNRHKNHYELLYKMPKETIHGQVSVPKYHYHNLWFQRKVYKNDRHFKIENIYRKLLKREADLIGLMSYYESDLTIKEIEYSIKESDEYQKFI